MFRRWIGPVAALLAALAQPAAAQIGVTTDIISGVITDSTGQPIAEAIVEAYSLETQITRSATTNQRGRFTILFTDGGGQYRMTARAIGMAPVSQMLYRQGEEDRLTWNAHLGNRPYVLDEITVRGGPPRRVVAPDGPTPGATERNLSADAIARLPIDPTDLNLLATLVPGVVGLDATDTTAAAFSVAGLGPEANAVTVDGLLFGSASLPQDGLRSTRVVTSTYDVSRGQFSGGLVTASTRSGSNVFQGSGNYSLRDDNLSVGDGSTAFSQGFTQQILSGGFGGPIVRDRLFGFISGQGRLRTDRRLSLLTAAGQDYLRLGVAEDSVSRFLGLVNGNGLPVSAFEGNGARSNDNYSALARVDYVVNNSHTLTLRGDWQGTSQDPSRVGTTALPQTGGTVESSGGGGMATLTSRFGVQIINEAKAYLSGSRRDGDSYYQLPAGQVQVVSDLADGSSAVSSLSFGGSTGMPTRSRATNFQATDELSWLSRDGAHRLRLGGMWNLRRSTDLTARNQFGTFTYNSLADLEANRPSSFRRTLTPSERSADTRDWAAYAGDVWRTSRRFQLTYGLRLEGSSFGSPPVYNPAVDSAFGRRTDRFPSEMHLSPRVGFNYMVTSSQPGQPGLIIRGGVGEFRSQVPSSIVSAVSNGTGLSNSSTQITCIGSSVPVPDWDAYRQDPSTIPDACVGGGPVPVTAPASNVTLFGDDFAAPRAWRASLGLQRALSGLVRLSVDASYARGVAQTGYTDLNLAAVPAFSLAGEAGRPIYVPSSTIIPSTGAVGFTGSRIDDSFGHVLETRSDLSTESTQLTVSLGGITRSGIIFNAAYTWSHARDESSGIGLGFGGGTTGSNPNQAEWSTSGFNRTHSFLLTGMLPVGRSLEVTAIARLSSGTPYTPLVGNDINGDGYRNDRAFIFLDDGTPEVRAGMRELLSSSAGRVRDCLQSQLGRIAGRNSCSGPWQASLDFQLNWRPAVLGLNRRLSVSVVTVNFLGGLDELLHGTDNLHGWGQAARPDATLLYVTGYDPANQNYLYSVNGRFGATGGTATAVRTPFQIGIQARITLGPDRARQALDAFRGRGGGGGGFDGGGRGGFGGPGGGRAGAAEGGSGFNAAGIIQRIRENLPNPALAVLDLKDSLGLTLEQVATLEPLADSIEARREAAALAIQQEVDKAGANPDMQRLMAALRPRLQEIITGTRDALNQVRRVLTPEQWNRVPDNLKNFTRPGGRQGPGGPDSRGE